MKLERPARVALRFARAPRAALVSRRAWLWSDASASLYALESGRLGELPCVEGFHRDSIAGVLEMRPRGADRRTYLAEALRRFESGGRVYTRAGEDGRGCAIWVTRGESGLSIPGIAAGVPLPPGSAVLCGFAGPAEEYAAAMAAALRGEFRDSTAPTRVFTWAPSADRARRRVLEEAGFVYAGEIRASTRFGRSRLDVPALA